MRCTALAEALKARGAETVFREHEIEPCDWLVVDHYELGAEWERAQRRMAKKIMAIDDLGREHDCDLLLDQNVLSPINPYAGRLPARARSSLARATRCAGVRPRTRACRARNGEVRRVLVCFGGADPANHTAVALERFAPTQRASSASTWFRLGTKSRMPAAARRIPSSTPGPRRWQRCLPRPISPSAPAAASWRGNAPASVCRRSPSASRRTRNRSWKHCSQPAAPRA